MNDSFRTSSKPRRWRLGICGLIAMVVSLTVVLCVAQRPSEHRAVAPSNIDLISMTQEGDRIILAAKKFLADSGKPPATIDDLVPKYLPELPPSTDGWGPWQMRPKSPASSDIREFAVRREIQSPTMRHDAGYDRISCYVYPNGKQDWVGVGGEGFSSHHKILRRAEP